MRAMICSAPGENGRLELGSLPNPDMIDGGVRIAVEAAALNFADLLMLDGTYQEKPTPPFAPGLEVAGRVIEVADGVGRMRVGDFVMAVLDHGGYAEQAVAREADCVPCPEGMGATEAAGFPIAYGTSHIGLVHRAGLRAGETLVVHGAGGGVGLSAVQIGAALGARVIATTGSAAKLEIARANGASEGIDYSTEDIRARIKELTDGRGADVVYDPVGGAAFAASLRAIAWGGRIVIVGFASGVVPQIPANHLLVKNCTAMGLYWGSYRRHAPEVVAASFADLSALYTGGKIAPHVSHTLELEDANDALDLLRRRQSSGKVVLTVDGS